MTKKYARNRGFHRGFHRGFTLVELLVVIAIIGILVGLLLPAVQAAREAARRMSCANNIAQLGLALHHYEFAMEHLPTGTINPTGPIRNEPIGQHVSWTVQILPYMEQTALARSIDISKGVYDPANALYRKTQIASLMCPSYPYSRSPSIESSIGMSTYAACYGDSEVPLDDNNNGVFFRNSRTKFSDIEDGASNTLFVSEKISENGDLGWLSGTRATLRNAVFTNPQRSGNFAMTTETNPDNGSLEMGGFSSYHSGGANSMMGDGAVRFLPFITEPVVIRSLATRNGQEIDHLKLDW